MKKVTITITGRPASKKNNRRNFGHVSLPSKAYERFHEDALWQLKTVQARFTGKVRIDYWFMQKGKMRQDVDNAMASINDVLQDAGIIWDDNDVYVGSFEKLPYAADWSTRVLIQEIDNKII